MQTDSATFLGKEALQIGNRSAVCLPFCLLLAGVDSEITHESDLSNSIQIVKNHMELNSWGASIWSLLDGS